MEKWKCSEIRLWCWSVEYPKDSSELTSLNGQLCGLYILSWKRFYKNIRLLGLSTLQVLWHADWKPSYSFSESIPVRVLESRCCLLSQWRLGINTLSLRSTFQMSNFLLCLADPHPHLRREYSTFFPCSLPFKIYNISLLCFFLSHSKLSRRSLLRWDMIFYDFFSQKNISKICTQKSLPSLKLAFSHFGCT